MSHEIDETTGTAAIAYVGETPWHGLGKALTADATIEQWKQESGLGFEVVKAPVKFDVPNGVMTVGEQVHVTSDTRTMSDRSVLFRSDTKAALSVVSTKGYKIVQPGEVLDFFGDIAKTSGLTLETAGALSGGKRVWALAKVNDGANVIGNDAVRPYILFATSYDGTMATVAQFTATRVVCNNTIQIALADNDGRVSIPHRVNVDFDVVRERLGLVTESFDNFLANARILADKRVTAEQAEKSLVKLLTPAKPALRDGVPVDVRQTRNYLRIMDLFNGAAIGSDISGGDNAWQLLNACTEFIDHEFGRTRDTGLTSAWFGAGAQMKLRAQEIALAI